MNCFVDPGPHGIILTVLTDMRWYSLCVACFGVCLGMLVRTIVKQLSRS